MDKAKIAKLCNEIEDIACDISQQTMNDIVSAESRMIFDKAKEIAAEISEPPKSNADRIRQMTDDELAEFIDIYDIEDICRIKNGERICGYGSFKSESHAREFMHLIAQLVQAKDETNGGADNG